MKQTILNIKLIELVEIDERIMKEIKDDLEIEMFMANNHTVSRGFHNKSSEDECKQMKIDQRLTLESYIEEQVEVVCRTCRGREVVGIAAFQYQDKEEGQEVSISLQLGNVKTMSLVFSFTVNEIDMTIQEIVEHDEDILKKKQEVAKDQDKENDIKEQELEKQRLEQLKGLSRITLTNRDYKDKPFH